MMNNLFFTCNHSNKIIWMFFFVECCFTLKSLENVFFLGNFFFHLQYVGLYSLEVLPFGSNFIKWSTCIFWDWLQFHWKFILTITFVYLAWNHAVNEKTNITVKIISLHLFVKRLAVYLSLKIIWIKKNCFWNNNLHFFLIFFYRL